MPRRAPRTALEITLLLLFLPLATALPSTALPPSNLAPPPPPPVPSPIAGDLCAPGRVRICDPERLLPPSDLPRVLAAARSLARRGCGSVHVDLLPRFTRPSVRARTARACLIRVRLSHSVHIAGFPLPRTIRLEVAAAFQSALTFGSPPADALEEALLALRSPPKALFAISWVAAVVVLAAGILAARRARRRPSAARCRRILARLDDGRARERAARFGGRRCPICLDAFRRRRPRRSTSSGQDTGLVASGSRSSSSGGSGSDHTAGGSERRVLPCGHAFHESCLIAWVTSPARNRAACPVCRTPARRARGVAQDAVSNNGTGWSGSGAGRVEDDSRFVVRASGREAAVVQEVEEAEEEGPTMLTDGADEEDVFGGSDSGGSVQEDSGAYAEFLLEPA